MHRSSSYKGLKSLNVNYIMHITGICTVYVMSTGLKLEKQQCRIQGKLKFYVCSLMGDTVHAATILIHKQKHTKIHKHDLNHGIMTYH